MPIYEYQCSACGHAFEKLIRNPADLPETCPDCGKKKLKKQFSAFAAKVASAAGVCKMADRCPAAAGHRHSGGCCGGACGGG